MRGSQSLGSPQRVAQERAGPPKFGHHLRRLLIVKRPAVVLGTLAVTSLFAVGALAEVRWVQAPAKMTIAASAAKSRAAESREVKERWVGTRAIVLENGKVRRPSASETATLVATLKELTSASKRPANITPLTSGGSMAAIEGGVPNVIIARPAADGTMETLCVHTFEEAAVFFGLVAQPAPGSGK